MRKDLQITNINWNYEESIKTTKFLVEKFKKCSLDIVRELHMAKEQLSCPGSRDKTKQTISTLCNIAQGSQKAIFTFSDYLKEIGLSKRTAYYWLSLYSPTEDKLYTAEEMKLKLSALFEDVYQIRLTNPEYSPEGWSKKQESSYEAWERKNHPIYIESDLVENEITTFEREYLEILQKEMVENPTPDDILHQQELCDKFKSTVTPLAPVSEQMHIVRYVEKSLEMFDSNKRAEIAKSLSRVLAIIALEMEE